MCSLFIYWLKCFYSVCVLCVWCMVRDESSVWFPVSIHISRVWLYGMLFVVGAGSQFFSCLPFGWYGIVGFLLLHFFILIQKDRMTNTERTGVLLEMSSQIHFMWQCTWTSHIHFTSHFSHRTFFRYVCFIYFWSQCCSSWQPLQWWCFFLFRRSWTGN